MSNENMFKCNARELKDNIIRCFKVGLVPFITSQPGIGKSQIVQQIADEFKLELIDVRMSMVSPEDIMGLPHFENGQAVFSPFNVFPTEKSIVPKGKNGWCLFLNISGIC